MIGIATEMISAKQMMAFVQGDHDSAPLLVLPFGLGRVGPLLEAGRWTLWLLL